MPRLSEMPTLLGIIGDQLSATLKQVDTMHSAVMLYRFQEYSQWFLHDAERHVPKVVRLIVAVSESGPSLIPTADPPSALKTNLLKKITL